MYSEKIMNVSVKAIMDVRYPRKNGSFPIRIRVIHRCKSKCYTTGKNVYPQDWEIFFSSRQKSIVEMKAAVRKTFEFVLNNVEDLVYNDFFSLENLDIRLGRMSAGTINSLFRKKIHILLKNGHIGTMDYYTEILKSIEKYDGEEVLIENITVEWLKKYEQYMLRMGMSYTTVSMRMRGVRTIMNDAKARGLIKESNYPFGLKKYEIKEYKSDPKVLSLDQIRTIVNYSDVNEVTTMYRDIWLFIFLCNGINPADLVNLKFKNIEDGEISFIREKTKNTSIQIKPVKVVVIPEMQTIIQRWGNKPLPENYIFPLIEHLKDPRKHKTRVSGLVKRINTHE